MSNIHIFTRVAQGLLAVAATGATVLALQLAMLAPENCGMVTRHA